MVTSCPFTLKNVQMVEKSYCLHEVIKCSFDLKIIFSGLNHCGVVEAAVRFWLFHIASCYKNAGSCVCEQLLCVCERGAEGLHSPGFGRAEHTHTRHSKCVRMCGIIFMQSVEKIKILQLVSTFIHFLFIRKV